MIQVNHLSFSYTKKPFIEDEKECPYYEEKKVILDVIKDFLLTTPRIETISGDVPKRGE